MGKELETRKDVTSGMSVLDLLNKQEQAFEPGFLIIKPNKGTKSFDAGVLGTLDSPLQVIILAVNHVRVMFPFGSESDVNAAVAWSPRPICTSATKWNDDHRINQIGCVVGEFPKAYDGEAPNIVKTIMDPIVTANYRCKDCPWSKFESAESGSGQACKETRRLLLYFYEQDRIAILSASPTSLKSWKNYNIALQEIPLSAVVTSITGVPSEKSKSITYTKLEFEVAREKGKPLMVKPDMLDKLGIRVNYRGVEMSKAEALLYEFRNIEPDQDIDYNMEEQPVVTDSGGGTNNPF